MVQSEGQADDKTRRPSIIEVHPQGDAIIVRGPKAIVADMEKYIAEQLDVQVKEVTAVPEATIARQTFNLKHVSADQIVDYLRKLYLADPQANEQIKAVKAHLIEKHPTLPRLTVEGPQVVVDEIGKAIVELDVAPPSPPVHKRYVMLDYMAAKEFDAILDRDPVFKGNYEAQEAPNNTLVISSVDESLLTKIEELKVKFDIDKKELRHIPLSYADAVKTAALLTSVYKAVAVPNLTPEQIKALTPFNKVAQSEDYKSQLIRETIEKAGVEDLSIAERLSRSLSVVAEGELTIVPDPDRNGLLIYTFSRNFPKILEMIDTLDQPRKQVFIDVFITEVSLDDTTELGVDFSYGQDFEGSRSGTYTVNQDFSTLFPTTGMSYQLISNNITSFIRALQETGKLDTVTRPQIFTKDNAKAVISLGRDVPIVTSTNVSSEGAINSTVKYEKVQTVLQVTPKIHPNGFVTLQIKQDIDDVSAETFQISEDFNPQVLIRRSAETQMRVRDGQTVCMGGFIGDSIIENSSKVPLLGDIPLLGELFKYSSKSHQKVELIIFITPHILENPEEMLRMTNEHRSGSNTEVREDRNTDILIPQRKVAIPIYKQPVPQQEDGN